jgi:magnesium chelatase family protein
MLAKVASGGVFGVDGFTVHVEADVRKCLEPRFQMVGLPETSVRESRVRVETAIRNSDIQIPPAVITINFAPADQPKKGTLYDLPVALGILWNLQKIPIQRLEGTAVIGELALDGEVRGVRGVLPIAMHVRDAGFHTLILPEANIHEVASLDGLNLVPVKSLKQAQAWLRGRFEPEFERHREPKKVEVSDFSEVRGQAVACRAAEIAAAGAHNMIMVGPPGCGKTMVARRMPGILPPLKTRAQLEVSKIWSVLGLIGETDGLVQNPPFRAPHHSLSAAGMVGGGRTPLPGEISLAHHGVIFMDELPEFPRPVLEALRQPLEDGFVSIVRGMKRASFPSRCMLMAAMNPCPCGWLGSRLRPCTCTSRHVHSYQARVSGPLLDRIDLHVTMRAITYGELKSSQAGESSDTIRARVVKARSKQAIRNQEDTVVWNADLNAAGLRAHATPDGEGQVLLEQAMERMALSARAATRILKVARTIADLEGADRISAPHIAEAVGFRRNLGQRP